MADAKRVGIETAIRRAFLASVVRIRRAVRATLPKASDFPHAVRSLPVRAAYASLERPLARGFNRAALAGMREARGAVKAGAVEDEDFIDEEMDAAGEAGDDVTFVEQLANEWALTQAGDLIVSITAQQLDAIQEALAAGMRAGDSLPTIARRIELTIGLSPRDARAVAKYAQKLIADGNSATVSERILQRRVDQLVRRRARTIARTERVAAREEAKLAEWNALIAAGDVPGDVLRKWMTRDPCPMCRELGKLPPVPLNKPFVTDKGEFRRPPAHTNCKCRVVLVNARTPGPRPGWRYASADRTGRRTLGTR